MPKVGAITTVDPFGWPKPTQGPGLNNVIREIVQLLFACPDEDPWILRSQSDEDCCIVYIYIYFLDVYN